MTYSASSPQNLKTIDALVPLVHELKRSLAKGTRGRSLSPKIKIFGDPIIITIKTIIAYGY